MAAGGVDLGVCPPHEVGRIDRQGRPNRSMAVATGESGVLECWRPRMALRFGHIRETLHTHPPQNTMSGLSCAT